MLKPSVGVALEGIPYIVISAFTTLLFAVLGCWFMTMLMLGVTCFVGHFFRDPERVAPEDADAVCSPADGKVIKVTREEDPITGEKRQVIAIFMNVFNVHVNRMPVSGKIEQVRYVPGKFINASFDKAHKDNERNIVVVTGKGNQRFTMVQIAGLIARRIVCWAEPMDKLKRGERFGLIKFGSRVDLYMPDGYVPTVSVGQKVIAGETPLAEKRKA
ncbi:Phosphatidylserine decarboxylase proenzyme [Pseudodesulfovibrio profundus]|uniref:Phosphatidylserine decarboxylase proenzyme n=1 Tax=Pseudodesulfovibrio profundus TaxID=57320 RepID=A0A2C8F2T7_9BACT|nr:phosphatidylserine decarboxylase family protein [Pseudodesulfovibrio profundus]MBC16510.1 phosphatidylserine decarboxylase family protein [Desulfovibrio sp.]SOB57025.1 Phosphatidylserine decarboxylase proenzyme [Pseudodesulfovibrio profundus]|tara:strand:- start:600 stop:1247 length:648 start_codon:yes stop_codon:yes gene_type:complete